MALSTRNVVTAQQSTAQSASFTYTFAYTVGAGTELLAVAPRAQGFGSGSLPAAVRWEDEFGGNAEPLVEGIVDGRISSSGQNISTGWWALPNPTARSGRIAVDYEMNPAATGDITSYSATALEMIGGVDTAAPIGAVGSLRMLSESAPLSITNTVAGAMILSSGAHYIGSRGPFTPDADITAELVDGASGTGSDLDHCYWAGEALTTAVRAHSVGYTAAVSSFGVVAAIEIKPAATGGASVSVPTAWRIRAQADAPVAWRVMAAAAQAVAWRVRAAASIDTAWRVMASTARSTAWRVLARVARPSAWRVRGRTAVPTAWRLLASRTRAVAWRLLRRTEVATGWRIGEALALRPEQIVMAAAHPRLLHADVHPRTLNARR